jgi:cation diffusion facilitator CzcD-associated flavoprotein CzcO
LELEVTGICVIGAGSAGLAAAQALKARGLDFTVFEAGSGLGGNWRYENDSGLSSGYASLTTNVSRYRTSYRCFRLPLRGPAFLHHTEMLDYLERFTDHFGLREHIRFKAMVTAARPHPEGGWEVEAADGTSERFRAVLVAVGYNSAPSIPELPGSYDGPQTHAHDYRTPEPFEGLDVLVIGLGSSACEVATEIRRAASSVNLSVRSGAVVLRRRLGGIPIDLVETKSGSHIPWRMRRRFLRRLILATGNDPKEVGLPPLPDPVGNKPFAIADGFFGAVRRGEIGVVGPVVGLEGDRVRLADGDELQVGAIVYATGYRTEFPFLPDEIEHPTMEYAPLYRGVASPEAEGLFFIGIVGGHGALIPMFEAQANWAAEVLSGRLELPPSEVMRQSIAADEAVRQRNFDPRWGFLYDRFPYIRSLERESRRARRRPGSPPRAAAATVG